MRIWRRALSAHASWRRWPSRGGVRRRWRGPRLRGWSTCHTMRAKVRAQAGVNKSSHDVELPAGEVVGQVVGGHLAEGLAGGVRADIGVGRLPRAEVVCDVFRNGLFVHLCEIATLIARFALAVLSALAPGALLRRQGALRTAASNRGVCCKCPPSLRGHERQRGEHRQNRRDRQNRHKHTLCERNVHAHTCIHNCEARVSTSGPCP